LAAAKTVFVYGTHFRCVVANT